MEKHSGAGLTLFCMNNLDEFGIQRVITWVVNNWIDVHGPMALSLHTRSGRLLEYLSEKVRVYELDTIQPPIKGLASFFRIIAYYRLIKRLKPARVIAVNQFESLALCLVKRFCPDFRLAVCEHSHVTSNINGADAHSGWFGQYYRARFSSEYRKYADIVHTTSFGTADDLRDNHGIPSEKIKVIYNPLDFEMITSRGLEDLDEPWLEPGNNTIVAASRLSQQKRLDILLRAWSVVKAQEPQPSGAAAPYRLVICGDGEKRAELEQLTRQLALEDSVKFVGFQQNPWKWIKRARLFVNTSEWESFCLALAEAQLLGTPVLSSDCPAGPHELLLGGDAGFLFRSQDSDACAEALIYALTHSEVAKEKASIASDNIGRFAVDRIVSQYAML